MIIKNIRDTFKTYDFTVVLCALIASVTGLVFIYSATKNMGSFRYMAIQTCSMIIGFVFMYLITKIDYEDIADSWKTISIICIAMLILVLIIGQGRDATGTRGWIRFGPVGIQPAELAKIGFIITFSKHLSNIEDDLNKISNVIALMFHFFVPVGLILLQPDTGTALVFTFIFISMLFVAGIYWRYIIAGFVFFAAFSVVAWNFLLNNIQKARFFAFLDPESAAGTYGYHVIQSKIAVGSGKFFGKGILKGIQTQLGILPEKHTDFIFAVIGEEAGFVICIGLVIALFALVLRSVSIGKDAKSSTGTYMCVGVASMWLFHIFENIGMTIGLVPVTGIPLPFVSYGGSSVITNYIAVGLVLCVYVRRNGVNF